MATTTANLTLTSSDLTSDSLSLSSTATLTEAGNLTGLTQTTGIRRRTFSSALTTQSKIIDAVDYTDDKAHKVYFKNLSTNSTEFVTVFVGDTELGRLYAGDFLFMPWSADTTGTNADIDIKTSASNMSIEWSVFVDTFA
jgi:hypothetical protein